LIFGIGFFPEWGIMGAAIATNIGRGVAVLYQLYILFSIKGRIQVLWKHFRIVPRLIHSLLKVSAGSMLQYLIGSAGWIFIVWIIGKFGHAAVAGYTIAFRVIIFSILPSWGMANAAATLVGQNLGAKQPDRAERSVWLIARYNFYFLMGLSVVLFILSRPILTLFGNDPEVLEYAVVCMRIIAFGYVFFGYGMIVSQSFNGAGDTWTPTWLNLISFWIIQMPLAWFIAVYFEFGVTSVYVVSVISETIFALLCIYLFRKGKWKEKMI
jgi:Na+-driven multidrug efflux pump